jgi:hypothetical protein
MNHNLRVALEMARAGIPVFPMRVFKDDSGKWIKKPAIRGWRTQATTNVETIKHWARTFSDAVFAIELEKAGLVVVDLDRHGGADGCKNFEALVAAKGASIPLVPMTLTSGGGRHFFFRQSEVPIGCPVRTALPLGIDIKGLGGNIVVPGSYRPDGAQWRPLDDDGRPTLQHAYRNGLAVIPPWIEQLARKVAPREKQSQQGSDSKFPPASDERGHAYAKAALDRLGREIADMRANSGRNNGLNAGAFSLGRMVARGWIDAGEVNVALFDAAVRCGLVKDDGADAVRATIASGLRAGLKQPHRDLRDKTKGFDRNGSKSAGQGSRSGKLINAQELGSQHFPDVRWIVPGLIPEGVTLLASRPKLGKSWLVLQICTAIATGVVTLTASDQPPVGDVLYAALEDNRRRLKRRLTKYFGPQTQTWPARLTLATEWPRLDQGGIDRLREWCLSVPKPALIVIDVLKKVRPPKKSGQTDYDADYMACEGLHDLTAEFGIGIIVVTHDRKMAADDVFDTISGTLGLTGGVDTIAILKRNAHGVTLHVQGRDLIDEIEKAVLFDRETCRWSIIGEAAEVLLSAERSRVLRVLQDAPDGLSTSEIVSAAQLRGRNAGDLLLSRMTADRLIDRVKRGLYGLPGARARLSSGKDGQKDRQNFKSLKSEGDEHLSVDLSSSLRQPKPDPNGHESQHAPPSKCESEVRADGSAADIRQSGSATLDLDIPTFLKRGHPDSIFGNLEETEVVRSESYQRGETGAGGSEPRTVGIPFMITNRMKLGLSDLGYTSDQIANMTPMEAQDILRKRTDRRRNQ